MFKEVYLHLLYHINNIYTGLLQRKCQLNMNAHNKSANIAMLLIQNKK